MLTVSITHHRRNSQVDHVQLPDLRLFSNKIYLCLFKSPESQVQNTLSRAWNKVRRAQLLQWVGPWDSPRKYLTKNSTQASIFTLSHLSYGSLINPVSSVWGVGGFSLTMYSAISSSLSSKAGVLQRKAAFSISSTVSVAVRNIGGYFSIPQGGLAVSLLTPCHLLPME